MKLMEATSVFLIIGGVLLGPILPQMVHNLPNTSIDGKTMGTMSEGAKNYTAEQGYARRETITETCERAMQEIGAREQKVPVDTGGTGDNPVWLGSGRWFVDSKQVLCIPSPSGLVR